jgi:mevalonate kinase
MERMSLTKPVEIIMGNTGITADTKTVVRGVRERKEKDPDTYHRLFAEANQLAQDARKDLEAFNLNKVGECMNQNHSLLQEIGVSSEELDTLVETARNAGALGAKLTGTGRGGYMVALTPGAQLQRRVASEISRTGYQVLSTTIGI